MLMLAKLRPYQGLTKIRGIRPDLANLEDINQELETELLNALVFAGDDVIVSMGKFIRKPDYFTFREAALAIRKDLWGRKTAVTQELLDALSLTNHKNEEGGESQE